MRNRAYEINQHAEIEQLLDDAAHGYLGVTTEDGWPGVFPVNFVYRNGRLYFHGTTKGEKMRALAREPRVTFTVVDDLSIVPSYFRDPRLACPATQYYRCAMIRGRTRVVESPEERAEVLQALMEKLQPEGGHEPIEAGSPLYRKALLTTAVTAIEIERMTGKFKVGQNLPQEKREAVRCGLAERGNAVDRRTVEMMRRYGDRRENR